MWTISVVHDHILINALSKLSRGEIVVDIDVIIFDTAKKPFRSNIV